jgi:MOSC domain-containing protein YiiM
MKPRVTAICKSERHRFSKPPVTHIALIAGHGVDGDSHSGATVQHRSRVARDPTQPNLRQVHLMHTELFDELAALGFAVSPGDLGENITTEGVDLLALGEGTLLRIGARAVVRITGLRNPCKQIDGFQKGLMKATLSHDAHGNVVRKAGVMAVVETGGEIVAGDAIVIEPPAGTWRPLVCV